MDKIIDFFINQWNNSSLLGKIFMLILSGIIFTPVFPAIIVCLLLIKKSNIIKITVTVNKTKTEK